jgi:hypothetical protein
MGGISGALDKPKWGDNRGTPSMTGKKTGLMSRIREKLDKQDPEYYMEFDCFIHQHSLCGRTLKSEYVMKVEISIVNLT